METKEKPDDLWDAYRAFAHCSLATPDAKGKFPTGTVNMATGETKPLTHAMSADTFDKMRTFMTAFQTERAAALSVQKQLVDLLEAIIADLTEGDFISLDRIEALRAAILAAKASS